jgi:hypothetical protein
MVGDASVATMPVIALSTRAGLRSGRVLSSVLVMVGLVACGDDDSPKGPGDASTDAAMDAGRNFIPKRDAAVAPTDPIRDCDRFDPNSCPAGLTCDVLIRLFAGQTGPSIYTGCVTPARERGLGAPCDPDFTTTTPYQTEGLTDLVFREPCGPNLVCAADPKSRGATSCQPACVTGQFQDNPVLCEDTASFCVGVDTQYLEYCHPSDSCNVTAQTGCPLGQNCYLRATDDGTGFVSVCYPPAMPVIADGAACNAYNACRPGSSCNGPIGKAPSEWVKADYVCRPSCAANGTTVVDDGDAGADDGGAGTATGCPAPKKCSSFAASGLNLSPIQIPPYGQCE